MPVLLVSARRDGSNGTNSFGSGGDVGGVEGGGVAGGGVDGGGVDGGGVDGGGDTTSQTDSNLIGPEVPANPPTTI
jgi:hypothetical protein